MISVTMNDGEHTLHIDYTDETIGFTVTGPEKMQLDFGCDKSEWIVINKFIDAQMNPPAPAHLK